MIQIYRISRPIYSGIRKYRSRSLDMGLCNISSSTKIPDKSLQLYISLQGSTYPFRSLESLRCHLYNVSSGQ